MTSSGTYLWNPGLGEICLYSLQLAQVRPTAILQEHMLAARTASNMILARWSQMGVNLWKVDLVTQALTGGVSTYNVDPSTISVLDTYISEDTGGAIQDRIMLPISRSEYANYPDKEQEGWPVVFWFDRLLAPTITIWPVPPVNGPTITLKYYRLRQIQDSNFTNGQTVDIPYRWMEAFADALAWRMARIWTPAIADNLKAIADESYGIAAGNDVEASNFFVSPILSGYWRT